MDPFTETDESQDVRGQVLVKDQPKMEHVWHETRYL